jgi:acetyl-CoA synthetase
MGTWIIGRMDDVIKVSGYRLGTAEIESALVSHKAARAAAIGLRTRSRTRDPRVRHPEGGRLPPLPSPRARRTSDTSWPIARPSKIEFVASLPKTRSGKIMRRVLKARALGQPEGDTSTLED